MEIQKQNVKIVDLHDRVEVTTTSKHPTRPAGQSIKISPLLVNRLTKNGYIEPQSVEVEKKKPAKA